MGDCSRGVSSVIGIVLLVGLTVVLAGSIAMFAFTVAEGPGEPAPVVGDSSAAYETGDTSCEDDIVRLTHIAGDTIDLAETYTIVRLPDSSGKEATITGFPTDGTSLDDEDYDDPDNIISDNCVRGQAANRESGTGEWAPGSTFSFKLNSGAGNIESGDRIEVLVVHKPSDAIIIEHELTV